MQLPHSVLRELAWSFSEALPESPDDLLLALEDYSDSIGTDFFAEDVLEILPTQAVDIYFRHWVREPSTSGPWSEVKKVIQLRYAEPPTLLRILFDVHAAAGDILREEDHHFFEGLEIQDSSFESGIPVYELYLGS